VAGNPKWVLQAHGIALTVLVPKNEQVLTVRERQVPGELSGVDRLGPPVPGCTACSPVPASVVTTPDSRSIDRIAWFSVSAT
jgi:hypothetical protein